MSGLFFISEYESNSDDSDRELDDGTIKRPKLPVPDLSKVPIVRSEIHIDDPSNHSGRSRAFPHVRGNWATFVFVKYPTEDSLTKTINKLKEVVLAYDSSWQSCEELHISLSKTVVLNYHLITPFTTSLQKLLSDTRSFDLAFGAVNVFCNEENSRTFISLEADYFCQKYLRNIVKKVDEVLTDFKLPTFYEDPSFHMSILWVNGNKKSEITEILGELNEILTQKLDNHMVLVDRVNCKSGNKHFQYFLE